MNNIVHTQDEWEHAVFTKCVIDHPHNVPDKSVFRAAVFACDATIIGTDTNRIDFPLQGVTVAGGRSLAFDNVNLEGTNGRGTKVGSGARLIYNNVNMTDVSLRDLRLADSATVIFDDVLLADVGMADWGHRQLGNHTIHQRSF